MSNGPVLRGFAGRLAPVWIDATIHKAGMIGPWRDRAATLTDNILAETDH